MKILETIDFLHKELTRLSEIIKFSDQKSGFIAIYYPIAIGIIYKTVNSLLLLSEKMNNYLFYVLVIILLCYSILSITGIVYLINSILPRLNNNSNSILFFKDIAKMSLSNYLSNFNKFDDEKLKNHLLEQIHTNSVIADKKMKNVYASTICLLWSGLFLVSFFVIKTTFNY